MIISDITIWNQLVKSNYKIKNIFVGSIDFISIVFFDKIELKKFANEIFRLIYIDIKPHCTLDTFSLQLPISYSSELNKLNFPENVEYLEIYLNEHIIYNEEININYPKNLLRLKFYSTTHKHINFTNLPTIKELDLSNIHGYNSLNFLPDSLKILFVPFTNNYDNLDIFGCHESLENLPSKLEQIIWKNNSYSRHSINLHQWIKQTINN